MQIFHDPNSSLTKTTLLLSSTLTIVAGAIIAPALPAMRNHFAGTENIDFLITLVLTLPSLFIVIGGGIAGAIIDCCTRKWLLFGSVLLYAVAGSSGFILESLPAILAGRALLGLSIAGITTSVTTLIADHYKGNTCTHLMGLQSTFRSFGGVVFLPLGGILADVNWRAPFLVYVIALAMLPLIALVIFDPAPECAQGEHQDTPKSLAGGEAAIVSPSEQSRVPVRLLLLAYASIFIVQVLFYLVPVFLPFYLEEIGSASGTQTGLFISVFALASALAALFYRHLKARAGFLTILAAAFALLGAGWIVLGMSSGHGLLLAGLAVGGIGMGLVMPNLNVWLTSSAPVALRGRVLGGFTAALFLGQFMSPILTQPIRAQVGLSATYALSGIFLVALAAASVVFKKQIDAATG